MHRTAIAGLAAIVIAYLALVHRQASPAWFGYYHDDSLYWTAAESLAAGDGYRMASVPGEPPQTKYPVLFPWLLSWSWRLGPEFPANLSAALWTVSLAGAGFLIGAFALLRQIGLGEGPALFITAVCALHPVMLHLSGLLLSDVPFMALAVWSLVFAGRALEGSPGSSPVRAWTVALLLALAAVGMRSIAVTLPAGFALAALWGRRFRPAAACAALAAVLAAWQLGAGSVTAEANGAGLSDPRYGQKDPVELAGYRQTMQFYMSYGEFWKLSTPDWPTLSALLNFNFREMLKHPAVAVFSIPAAGFAGFGWQLAAVALSFTVIQGMASLTATGRHPAFTVLAAYAVVVLVWNYTILDRFFAWALPLFAAGAWHEIGRLAQTTRRAFSSGAPRLERAVAAMVMAAFAAVGLYAGQRYLWAAPQAMAASLAEREQLQRQKQQAYRWIRDNTAASDRFIADEDASLYLYTGRQALRPMAFSTAAFYLQSEQALDQDLAHMGDVAATIGARYWLAAADDYHLESGQEFIQKRSDELLKGHPEVFVSDEGAVRVYDIGALTHAAGGGAANPSRG